MGFLGLLFLWMVSRVSVSRTPSLGLHGFPSRSSLTRRLVLQSDELVRGGRGVGGGGVLRCIQPTSSQEHATPSSLP